MPFASFFGAREFPMYTKERERMLWISNNKRRLQSRHEMEGRDANAYWYSFDIDFRWFLGFSSPRFMLAAAVCLVSRERANEWNAKNRRQKPRFDAALEGVWVGSNPVTLSRDKNFSLQHRAEHRERERRTSDRPWTLAEDVKLNEASPPSSALDPSELRVK